MQNILSLFFFVSYFRSVADFLKLFNSDSLKSFLRHHVLVQKEKDIWKKSSLC